MPKLDIVVTHYNEHWKDCYKFFDMLNIQRGADWNDVHLIIVQDGENTSPFSWTTMMNAYQYDYDLITIPHSGVSTARNTGLSHAVSDWVMFCDCDDMLYSCDSLRRIIVSIDQAEDMADLLWSSFWIEYDSPNYTWHKVLKEWNTVFIHGKIYRRQFLMDNNITFDPDLSYAEDGMFNALVAMSIDPKRVASIPEIIYMWCNRTESLSNYTGGTATRNLSLYRMRVKRCEAYESRGNMYEAEVSAVRSIMDYYWELTGSDNPPAGGTADEWHARVKWFLDQYPDCCKNITSDDWNKLLQVTEGEARLKRIVKKGRPSIRKWIESFTTGGVKK